jgi:hypothetical protein
MSSKFRCAVALTSIACAPALLAGAAKAQSFFDMLFGAPQRVQPPVLYAPPVQRYPAWGAEPSRPRIFKRRAPRNRDGEEDARASGSFGGFGRGAYRTLCVRSCDGYYWPISHATSRGHFKDDEKLCKTSCPNQKVALYVHRTEGQWSENVR